MNEYDYEVLSFPKRFILFAMSIQSVYLQENKIFLLDIDELVHVHLPRHLYHRLQLNWVIMQEYEHDNLRAKNEIVYLLNQVL
jgi:hypothetical protein